jgi:type III restriction enzyme
MPRVSLQDLVEDIPFDILPVNWTAFDLSSFSQQKQLWDYQQDALKNTLRALWKYYEDFDDFSPKETPGVNTQRKQKFAQWYRANGQNENLDIQLKNSRALLALLGDYYQVGTDGTLSYEQFLNRACFWMATGSGKTLVIVKLVEILQELIKRGEIPWNDILVLTHRDDLIEHLKTLLNEFNASNSALFINMRELREYAEVKRNNPSLFKDHEITVFYYRSDNLSDEQKEKIIDFRNYDNGGRWYVLLDEAHKGDKEDSKRQHIYSILSRNGFLFNFSATFIDRRDLVATACNFNLSEFISAGYGKHIAILQQEIRAFKDEEDYNAEEKQKIVLKSLLLLTYAKKFATQVYKAAPGMYHDPLLLTLVNSVNTEDADLKLFFREIERIGKGRVTEKLWQIAKNELWEELKERPNFMFEDDQVETDEKTFNGLNQTDMLKLIFNSNKPGDIEILVRPSNRQEIAFKLKTSDRPFALIKIGDIAEWLKDELAGYEINQSFEDESYFQQLNEDESDINILMGSRSFYEGWDSNRPNVINFINIGTGTEAKKFILQSIGRGVRIEPMKNKRKRLLPLYNAKEVNAALFNEIKGRVAPLETLFIFGTNRDALKTVIEHLSRESRKGEQQQLSLFLNKAAEERTLLIPAYRLADEPMAERRKLAKFEIAGDELALLKRYVDFVGDDRIMLALHDAEPAKLRILRDSLAKPDDYFKADGRSFKNTGLLVDRILDYFSIVPEDFYRLKELADEIRHFKQISVSLKDISELTRKVESVAQYQNPESIEAELDNKLKRGEITLEEYKKGIKLAARMVREETVQYGAKQLRIKHLANHYYIPIILSGETDRISYIKHIIQERSEIDFINKLEDYVNKPNNKFNEFDWWLFSKLDESLDEVYIPYYNPKSNGIAHFKPDFIFWLQKGRDYFIIFIDPKGTAYTDYQYKIDGYKEIFEENDAMTKKLSYDKLNTRVFTFLYTPDDNRLSKGYKKYWFDNMEKVLNYII